METKEGSLIENEGNLKKAFVIFVIMFGILILGYFTGKGLYHILH